MYEEKTLSPLLDVLFSLQQLDDRLAEMGRKKKEIPDHIRELEKALEERQQRVKACRERIEEAARRQRELEGQLKENAEERKKKQRRLQEVKSNDEYKAILKEIEYTKEADSKVEDEILLLFEELERLEKELEAEQGAAKAQEEALRADKSRLEREIHEIEKEHRLLENERRKVCDELDAGVLADYERIRTRRAGLAVVAVKKEVCPGCHMYIPAQTINEVLQTGEIRHCPHCRRILYCELEESGA